MYNKKSCTLAAYYGCWVQREESGINSHEEKGFRVYINTTKRVLASFDGGVPCGLQCWLGSEILWSTPTNTVIQKRQICQKRSIHMRKILVWCPIFVVACRAVYRSEVCTSTTLLPNKRCRSRLTEISQLIIHVSVLVYSPKRHANNSFSTFR